MLHATNTSSLTESIRDYKTDKHRAWKRYVLYKQEERKTDKGKKNVPPNRHERVAIFL